jgi:hypothetical protein
MKRQSITVSALIISVLAIATVAIAQSPFTGTWKLNLKKSKFISAAPLGWTDVFREIEDDQVEVTTKIILPDQSVINEVIVWPRQGGIATFRQGGTEGVMEVETLISPDEWLATRMVNGKQTGLVKLIVSKNGKTMRYTFTGLMEGEAVFEKQ